MIQGGGFDLDMNKKKTDYPIKNESYNKLREYHLNGEQHKNKYCADCTEWQGMTWDYDYFVAMEKMLGEKFL